MNWIRLFENFREQPLEREDIENLLQGTGIIPLRIREMPIRMNYNDHKFYLGWEIICEDPKDWIYPSPRNYKVQVKLCAIEFIWLIKPNTDVLLSKITAYCKEIKMWLDNEIFNNDLEKKVTSDIYEYKKGFKVFLTYNKKLKKVFLDKKTFLILRDKTKLSDVNLELFLVIYLQNKFNIEILSFSK